MHRTTRLAAKADTLSAVALLASDGRHHADTTGSAKVRRQPVDVTRPSRRSGVGDPGGLRRPALRR